MTGTLSKQEEMIKKVFAYFYQVNDHTRAKGHDHNKVLVHCAMGMSRSATSVIMYLMRKFKVKHDDALDLVKT